MEISKISNEPLSYRTRHALMKIIQRNTKDGATFKLPKEEDLAKMLGVSRNVLRDALTVLEQAGYVTRRRSIGTIANPSVADTKCRIDMEPDMTKIIEEAGYQVKEEILDVAYVKKQIPCFADDEQTYLTIKKLFYADGHPAIYCVDCLPERVFELIPENLIQNLRDNSEYNILKHHADIAYLMARIGAEIPESWLREIMQLEEMTPVLYIEDHSYNFDHEIVAWSMLYFKQHMFNLRLLRKSW